jgi:hypothetical protein
MIVLASILAGAIIGGLKARKRGGAVLDIAQYAASFAIIFGLVGLLATILISRTVT